jgi:hypothetical protein
MYLAFNELSINPQLTTVNNNVAARQIINEFIEFLHFLKSKNLIEGIITTADIHTFYVTQNYGINEWFSDHDVKHLYKQFFRIFCSKKCLYPQLDDFNSEFTVTIDKIKYNGIGCIIAVETNNSMVSVLTNEYWKQRRINGQHIEIDEEANIAVSEKCITNVSKKSDLSIIESIIKKTAYDSISSGQDLWEQRETLFPNLIFCESVKAQLYNDPEKFHILQIIEKLQRIEEYFKTYNGIYNPKELGLNARTESDTVKSYDILKIKRRFRKPNGEDDYFFDHIGFSGKFTGGRIYFLPEDTSRKCYIGYIGRHLQTKKF